MILLAEELFYLAVMLQIPECKLLQNKGILSWHVALRDIFLLVPAPLQDFHFLSYHPQKPKYVPYLVRMYPLENLHINSSFTSQ